MGLLSKVTGVVTGGLVGDDPFKFLRTGASSAARDAKESGEQALNMEKEWLDYIKQSQQPAIDTGNLAREQLAGLYGIGGDQNAQQAMVNQIQQSPFYENMVNTGEQAIARNAAATGGFRSGNMQQNLAQNSQNVLQGLYNQRVSGLSGLAGMGQQANQNILSGGGQALNNITRTMGNIANIGINQAGQRQNMIGGLAGGLSGVLGGLI